MALVGSDRAGMMLSSATSRPVSCIIEKNGGPCCIALSAPETQKRRLAMKVKEVVHKGVDWVSPNTPVTELAKLMREHDIGTSAAV
jgi:hypothetical protein